MHTSRKRRLTFMERVDPTVLIALLLSVTIFTAIFYYLPFNRKSYLEYSEEYKKVTLEILNNIQEDNSPSTSIERKAYTIIINGAQEETYYYSIDNEKRTITVREYIGVLSYEYSMKLGEGILNGYVGKKVMDAAFPAFALTSIEFLIGAVAFLIASLPRCIKCMLLRRKANHNVNKPKT